MSPVPKGAIPARKKGQGSARPRTRVVPPPRAKPKHGAVAPAPLRVMPAGPVAAFGLGELLIRAWAARQHAA